MAYPSAHVANAVLKSAFTMDMPITPTRLQCLLYLLSERYYKATGMHLIDAQFTTHAYGPRIAHIDFQFAPAFEPHHIQRYAKDAESRAWMISDPVVQRHIHELLTETSSQPTIQLLDALRAPGSAWYEAWQRSERYLHDPAPAGA